MASTEYAGPLSFAVFALPAAADLTGPIDELERLQREHLVEVLDIELIVRDEGGAVRRETLGNAAAEAAETDLLDEDDLAAVGEELRDGERALVVVYEDRSLAPVALRISALSGREIWTGGIDAADLDDADADAAGEGSGS